MRFAERWYRFLVRAFPETGDGERRAEVLTTLEDTGRLNAAVPSPRESVLLVSGAVRARSETVPMELRTSVVSGLALGSVMFLGFAWIRHLIAWQRAIDWGYAATPTDWFLAALPVFVVLGAASSRRARTVGVVVFATILAVLAWPSISDAMLVEEAGWIGFYAFRFVWFVAPVALVAATAHAVERRSALALSFAFGTLLGWSRMVSFTMLPVIGDAGLLGWGVVLVALMVVTPVPIIAFATASSLLVAGMTLVTGPSPYLTHVLILWVATVGVGVFLLRGSWRISTTLRS